MAIITTTVRPLPRLIRTPTFRRFTSVLTFLFPFACLISAWWWLASTNYYPRNFLPAPLAVFEALADKLQDGTLQKHVSASMGRLGLGIVVSLFMGVGFGMIMGLSRGVAEFFEPLTSFLNALSGIAWVPLAIVWFGLGQGAVTFILWNAIFFLVMFNTLLGVKAVPRVFMNAVLTMGGGKWRVIRDVMLPGAMPNIILGVRMGIGFGWRALIAAEMIGATSGLGFMIFDASYFHRTDVIMAGILVIGVIWLVTDRLILIPLERRTIERWGLINVPT